MLAEEASSDRLDSCCCNSVHIKTGAYSVAVVYAVIIISNLGIRVYKSAEVEWNWQLLFFLSDSLSVACLFFGVVRHRPAFLQPFTVVSILTISFCILLTLFYGVAMFQPTSYFGEQVEILLAENVQLLAEGLNLTQTNVIASVAGIGSLVYACTVVLHTWFMLVVVRCAQHFRAVAQSPEEEQEDETSSTSSISPPVDSSLPPDDDNFNSIDNAIDTSGNNSINNCSIEDGEMRL